MSPLARLRSSAAWILPLIAVLLAGPGLCAQADLARPALEFAERVVAGGPDAPVTVRHLRLGGSQRDIGRKLAAIAAERHGVRAVERDHAVSLERDAFYREVFPTHHLRVLGARDHFGLAPDDPRDASTLPYNLPRAFGCSVVYFPPGNVASGHATLSRNYDFVVATWSELYGETPTEGEPCTTADPYVIESYPDQGHASLFLCAYDLLGGCLDGINSEGLTVALLSDAPVDGSRPAGSWRPGLYELEIGRWLLETCATVEEARSALEDVTYYYALVPCHYLVGDRSGRSLVWESSGDLRQRYVIDGGGAPQVVTNHPLAAFPDAAALDGEAPRATFKRFCRLTEELERADGPFPIDEMKRVNREVAVGGTGNRGVRTLWHALYDCEARTLSIDFWLGDGEDGGPERRSGYLSFSLAAGP
ncbi:MAG: carcinine hydrolase/isopenicillin-N N-acyltransferase family protein [Planctomycetota bacterium]|jgi:hypothetical protein